LTLLAAGLVLLSLTAPADEALPVSMWAMDASREGRPRGERHLDRELLPIRDTIEALPFDTFTTVRVVRAEARRGREAKLPINERYTLYLTWQSGGTDDEPLCLAIRVEKQPEGRDREKRRPVNAFATRVEVRPGQKIKFKGLRNDGKELVIVLRAG